MKNRRTKLNSTPTIPILNNHFGLNTSLTNEHYEHYKNQLVNQVKRTIETPIVNNYTRNGLDHPFHYNSNQFNFNNYTTQYRGGPLCTLYSQPTIVPYKPSQFPAFLYSHL